MGDAAHQARTSDHNEGNAFDVTHDSANGLDLDALADALMRDDRVHYVIWNRRICNSAFEDGAWRPSTGTSPHTEHLHVSIDPEQRDDTTPWALSADEAPQGATPVEASSGRGHAGAIVAGLRLLIAAALLLHVQQTSTTPARRGP
jgi:hypothetical protein